MYINKAIIYGNITAKTYTIALYSLSTNNLNASLASCTISGAAITQGVYFGCTFSSYYTISSGTTYGLSITANATDDTNVLVIGSVNGTGGLSGLAYYWANTKVGTSAAKDMNLKLYEAQ